MNAPIINLAAERARAEARELAEEILAGKHPNGPWLTTVNYSPNDWQEAAQYLVDSDDCDEVLHMIAVERAWEGRSWTQADYDNDDTYAGEWR